MPSNNLISLYTYVPSTTVSTNNFTTLYNATPGNVTTANVPDRNFTTLYTQQTDVQPTYPYGNANVESFLNVGYDAGGNIVENINANGYIHANGNLTIVGTTSLGNVGNVHITGGNINYILETDGSGNLNWVALPNVATATTEYISFSVVSTGNNQTFTNANLAVYANSNVMAVFKNGVNLEPNQYSISGSILTISILLNTGDSIDVLPGAVGSNLQPGGNLTEVQYNGGSGLLSGNSSFTFDQPNAVLNVTVVSTDVSYTNEIYVSNVANLGNVSNVHIGGGANGYVLKTDGTGNLSWITQGNTSAGGSNTQVQYNNNNTFGGSANFVFNNTTNTLSVTNIIANGSQLSSLTAANIVGEVANANYATNAGDAATAISATTAGYAVNSDIANTSITVTGNSQPNITSIGQLTSLASNGVVDFTNTSNVSLGNVSNLHITGGAGGQVLSTDGAGNLSWTSFSSTSITNGNSNVNVIANANVNISSAGVANVLVISSTGANLIGTANLGNLATSNYFSGSGNLLSNIQGANITGAVGLATYATTANAVAGANVSGQVANALIASTVYTNAQPNITSVGTLSSLDVSGNITSSRYISNITTGNAPFIVTSTTQVANLHVANAGVAGTVYTNAQPNITSVGTLTALTVSGNLIAQGNVTIQRAFEVFTPNATGSTGTVNFDTITQSILVKTANATANFTLNVRGNSTVTLDTLLPINDSITIAYVNPVGATAYVANAFTIDGTSVTPKYVNGVAPTIGTRLTSATQTYTYSILKTAANTYTVLGSLVEYQ
jgi:hypothetical protein